MDQFLVHLHIKVHYYNYHQITNIRSHLKSGMRYAAYNMVTLAIQHLYDMIRIRMATVLDLAFTLRSSIQILIKCDIMFMSNNIQMTRSRLI